MGFFPLFFWLKFHHIFRHEFSTCLLVLALALALAVFGLFLMGPHVWPIGQSSQPVLRFDSHLYSKEPIAAHRSAQKAWGRMWDWFGQAGKSHNATKQLELDYGDPYGSPT